MLLETKDQLAILERIEQRLDRIENNLDNPSVDRLKMLSCALNLRRAKNSSFPEQLFSTSAWDILLELYEAHLTARKLSIQAIGEVTNISQSTLLRYFDILMKHGFIYREHDSADADRSHVQLTKSAIEKLDTLFENAFSEPTELPPASMTVAQ